MDEKELAKQLSTYADAITAFVFVQGVAFALLIAQSKDLPGNVARQWYIAVSVMILMTCGYLWMVSECNSAEDKLLGIPSNREAGIAGVIPMIRRARSGLIVVMGVAEIVLVVGLHIFTPLAHCSLGGADWGLI
jgi:uncharacterized membrane protein (DUF485 family)